MHRLTGAASCSAAVFTLSKVRARNGLSGLSQIIWLALPISWAGGSKLSKAGKPLDALRVGFCPRPVGKTYR